MSKYDTLGEYLGGLPGRSCSLTFGRIEEILGESLPPGADLLEWWTNEESQDGHPQARSWVVSVRSSRDGG